MRRRLFLVAFTALGIAAACDDFAAGTSPDAGDGGTTGNEGGPTDDSGGRGDATAAEGGANTSVADEHGLYVNCPRTAAVSSFESHTPYTLSSPPPPDDNDRDYPFGVVTDVSNVYWVSQQAKVGNDDENTEAYNGAGKRGRIHRVAKNLLTPVSWKLALAVAADQELVNDIALDGDHVYWAVGTGGKVQMRRIPRGCDLPCKADDVGTSADLQQVIRLRRARDGLLAGLTRDGVVVGFDTVAAKWEITSLSGRSGGFALRNGDAFASRSDDPKIGRVQFGPPASTVTDMFATIDEADGGGPADRGTGILATDCQSLFGVRFDRSIWRLDIDAPSPRGFAPWGMSPNGGTYDLFADARFVYVAGADGSGLIAVSIATQLPAKVADGSYWRVTADESGVFAGEHTNQGVVTGSMLQFK